MTDDELAELERLMKKASPAPWRVEETRHRDYVDTRTLDADGHTVADDLFYSQSAVDVDDQRFIAAARNALPRLIAALRAAKS
jgi:hypothetical protein